MMNKKGVTLIELIVVFVIIAIAAALAAPNIGGWLPRYRLRSATRDIVSTMRDAQMKAVTYRMQYQVNFTVDADSYRLQHTSGGTLFNDGPVRRVPDGITINIASLPGGIALFDPSSTCPSGGTVTLFYQKGGVTKGQRAIVLNAATGGIRIVE
jgi:prepilin-type N-terminal cleavage/methylation domain-containing protein